MTKRHESHLLDKLGEYVYFDPGGCWTWRAGRCSGGYGNVSIAGETKLAHRVMYELIVGPISRDLQIDHLCRNRACVNPGHLETVSPKENSRRRIHGKHQAKKTHCPHGHEYSSENTYRHITREGWVHRVCRACKRERYQARA